MRKIHLLSVLIAATLLFCSSVDAKELTTVVYTVSAGDTMDSIAEKYMPTDWGPSYQAFAEFREGIFEYNYDRLFLERKPYEVRAGDYLLINLWK